MYNNNCIQHLNYTFLFTNFDHKIVQHLLFEYLMLKSLELKFVYIFKYIFLTYWIFIVNTLFGK